MDEAIASLKSMMNLSPFDRKKPQVILAGGANMTMPADTDPSRLVGSINSEFALRAVREAGFRILFEDVGGTCGKQVTIDCTTGTYTISEIPRLGT